MFRTVALIAAFLTLSPARAEDSIDPKAKDVLKKLGTLHKDAKSIHVEMTIEGAVERDGADKRDLDIKATIDLKRPNQFALRTVMNKNPNMGPDFICDGKNLIVHGKKVKQYTEKKAPAKLSDLGQELLGLGHHNSGMLFQNVVAEDPVEALLDGVTEAKYAGKEKVGGKEAHHLTFKQPGMDWELWVAAEGQPVVLKAKNNSKLDDGKMTTTETYTNWKINENFEKDPFTFKAPADSKKVDELGR